MGNPILFSLPGNKELTQALSNKLSIEIGKAEIHTFPDSESYIRINSKIKNKKAFSVCTLDQPNSKILPLILILKNLMNSMEYNDFNPI
ncbi:ribose-phosphate pyrophosphokinase [Legionella gratiana]|uniref:Ribose-phosphate pyrophosphokinase n=1 Tax=Legionella gratiana TaxID=45066 RepID=A0A378JMM3_9GAMM|nr:ribose-phosphate pyrophosphokinase-like domain-containing protein [Legionella gratiana]KTD13699.1 ribose-phosphate pyrophosphokinase [Legionella gratiana]STX45990.1 ribose-phosphate pyrophosphokinase [Legionella gratiana]